MIKGAYIKEFLAYTFVGFFSFGVSGQDQVIADSLVRELDSNPYMHDTLKCDIYNAISFNSIKPSDEIRFAKKAFQLARVLNDHKRLAKSNRNLGNAYRLTGDLTRAIEHYLSAAELYATIDSELGMATIYSDLGDIYDSQKNYSYSLKSYKKSIMILRKLDDSLRLASVVLNCGDLYRKHGNYDSALVFSMESKSLFSALDHKIGLAYSLGNIGLIEVASGRAETAEDNLLTAISILEEYRDIDPISSYMVALSELYKRRGELGIALNFATNALDLGEQENLKEQIRDASLKLSQLYEIKGDFKNAFFYQKQYLSYRDSINNEEVIRKMADLRTEFEVGQKQIEVDLLNQEAQTQRIILWAVIAVLILVFILAYVLFKLYKLRDRAIKIARKRREVISAQRNELAELNKTKDKFFSIISHDIRAPVNNFQGVAQLINLYVESGETNELIRIAEMMEKSSSELSSLLDNLLDWAMSQQGRVPFKPEPFSMSDLCRSSLTMMENLAESKGLTMNRKIEENVLIHADRNSISTIIRNLLNNAIKFTEEGGVVGLSLAQMDNQVVLKIEDTGIGIVREKLEELFSFKGERTRWGTAGEKGVGLGLNLVHEFVEMNDGSIEVESEEGVGTTFIVKLPIK